MAWSVRKSSARFHLGMKESQKAEMKLGYDATLSGTSLKSTFFLSLESSIMVSSRAFPYQESILSARMVRQKASPMPVSEGQ